MTVIFARVSRFQRNSFWRSSTVTASGKDNPKLTEIADKNLGGTRAQGRYTSRDAYDGLEIAVNKYLDSQARELMQMDVTDVLASVLRPLTKRLPRQCHRTFEQTEPQQFSTPPTLAYLAAQILNPQSNDTVLQPSAGTGSLAIWLRSIGAQFICNEINPRRRALLTRELAFETHHFDALTTSYPVEIRPTAILMNPPFSARGRRVARHSAHYGARHIGRARVSSDCGNNHRRL